MTLKLSRFAAVAAVLFTVAGSAIPASADSYDRNARDHAKIVTVSDRHDGDRYGPPRFHRVRENMWREMHMRHFHHHHRFENSAYER